MPPHRMSGEGTGAMHNGEEEDEQSEKCVGLLLSWLQAGDLLPTELLGGRRLTAHLLADLSFITHVVERICPATSATQTADAPDETASELNVIAGCLAAVFRDAYGVELDAEAAVQRALLAGERDMEPLGDIVALWRFILTFAVCGESKQRHIDCIMHMPAEFQAGLMELIEATERRLTAAAQGSGGSPRPRSARVSLSELRDRTSCSGQRSPRASVTSLPLAGGEPSSDGHDSLVQENQRLREQVRQLAEQVHKDRQLRQRTTTVLDGEFETFEKSWNLEKLLRERDDAIQELEQKLRESHLAVEENRRLQEELLLAQAREAEHAAVKARLERCTQRLEEAGDLKLEVQAYADKYAATCRERDALNQELVQVRGAGQQLDAWKAKVRELELRQHETEAKVHSAEAQAKAMEADQQRLSGEKAILEDKLQDCQLEVAALRESGPRGSEGGEVVEPFTVELQERMRNLEDRNAQLEQQLSAEGAQRVAALLVEGESLRGMKEHWEQSAADTKEKLHATEEELQEARGHLEELEEAHAEQGEQLSKTRIALEEEHRRAEAAEEQSRTASERTSMLSEELRQRLEELLGLGEQLEEAGEALASSQRELELQRESSKVQAELLQEFGRQLGEVSEEASELQATLRTSEEALHETREQARSSCRELEASNLQITQLEQRCTQLQEARAESLRLQREVQQLSEQERQARVDSESRLRAIDLEKVDLARQLQHIRCEQLLRERSRSDLAEREEVSAQRQSDLLVRIDDLRHGLSEEAAHNKNLREQLEASEFFCKHLKAALRRFSAEELRRLEEELEEAAAAGQAGGVHSAAPESEMAQIRVENRRLHAQLAEQRLRGAEEAKRSAQACARLRQFERCAEQGQQAEGERPSAGLSPVSPFPCLAAQETPSLDYEAPQPLSARPVAAAPPGPGAGTLAGQAPLPRRSLLKKPKQALDVDFNAKENHWSPPNVANNGISNGAKTQKTKGTFIRAKRPGLIGCIS